MTDSTENEMKKLLTILALCLACTGAFAQTATPAMGDNPQRMAQMAQQLQSRFANANTTQDGKLTRQQAAAGMPMVARHFDEIDTAKAGYVTLPQIEAFMQQRAAAH
jgi:methionyl-tRNA synthetase